jgi:hypothetical protein
MGKGCTCVVAESSWLIGEIFERGLLLFILYKLFLASSRYLFTRCKLLPFRVVSGIFSLPIHSLQVAAFPSCFWHLLATYLLVASCSLYKLFLASSRCKLLPIQVVSRGLHNRISRIVATKGVEEQAILRYHGTRPIIFLP